MGGLRKKMPFAFWAMLIGVLSICGIPGFSGFFSKDEVIYGALAHGHPWLYAVGIVTAGITAYYMFRMLFVTFLGDYRGNGRPPARARLGDERAGRDSDRADGGDRRGADVRRRKLPAGRGSSRRSSLRPALPAVPALTELADVGHRAALRAGGLRDRVDCATRPGAAQADAVERLRARSGTHAGVPRQSLLLR